MEHLPDGKIVTLKNGLRIWTIPKPSKDCKTYDKVHLGLFIYSGLYTERKEEIEYNHFLEHLLAVFPSKKYPKSRDNNSLLEKNGITALGTVDEYKTHIWLEGLPDSFDLMIDYFINGLLDFKVDDSIFRQEKIAVLTELTDTLNDPFCKLDELYQNILYPGHPLSLPMSYHIYNVKRTTPQKLEDYFKRMLNPKYMIVYVSGNLSERGYQIAISKFSNMLSDFKIPKAIPALDMKRLENYNPIKRKAPNVYYIKNDTPTTKMEWIWLTNTKIGDVQDDILDAIESILKDKLFDQLRMYKGLIYTIKIYKHTDPINKYISNLNVSTDVIGKKALLKTMKEFARIINTLDQTITHDDLLQYRRKKYREYQDKFGYCNLETPIENHIEKLLFIGKTKSLEIEMEEKLNVTLPQIKNCIKEYFTLDKSYIFYSGRHKIF